MKTSFREQTQLDLFLHQFICFSDSDDLVRRYATYPPHLSGPVNETMPSALIPFCSYQSETLGKTIPGFDILACDSFQPVVQNGRLCYSLKNKFERKAKRGKKHGLLLMIDPGKIEEKQNVDEEHFSFELYLHTLSGFSGFKAGSYSLTSLKQMIGTAGFMNLPEEQKRCHVEVREDCQRVKLFDEFQKQCKCIP